MKNEINENEPLLVASVGGSYSMILSLENLPNEFWKDIPNYDGIYQCSNYGRIKSLKREYIRKTKHGFVSGYTKEIIKKPVKIKPKKAKCEVLMVKLSVNGVHKTDTVSQWVGVTFLGDKKKGFHFQHKNKNSLDNRLVNIEQTTIRESKSNDFKYKKREPHNFRHLPKQKLKIIRDDGVIFSYSDIVREYNRSAYFNILKGYKKVKGREWKVQKL